MAKERNCWVGMSKDIDELIGSCVTCTKRCRSKPNDPLVPARWNAKELERMMVVSTDHFSIGNKMYLIVVDTYSSRTGLVIARSNGSAESRVGTCKKTMENGEDVDKALSEYCNMPTHDGHTPSSTFFRCVLRTSDIPCLRRKYTDEERNQRARRIRPVGPTTVGPSDTS